ncbi:MAG: helix-turn-helix domain-containing protein, partial [Cytophagaceae bacterium]
QFSALLDIERAEGRFTPLLGWMRERLSDPLTVETLSAQSNMSPRNFARAFLAETGVTPAKAVERLRLESARERVEHSTDSIDVIAQDVGFGVIFRIPGQRSLRLIGDRANVTNRWHPVVYFYLVNWFAAFLDGIQKTI